MEDYVPDHLNHLVLNKTIFHPQGGGQPSDRGFIESEDGSIKFKVERLTFIDDAIVHVGRYLDTDPKRKTFEEGDKVILKIDKEFRIMNTRLHSAGHLIDIAMKRAEQKNKPVKGYHYKKNPHVEYTRVVAAKDRDALQGELNIQLNNLIKEATMQNYYVFNKLCSDEEAKNHLENGIPDNWTPGNHVRVVKLTPDCAGWACDGTHVNHINELGIVRVTRIRVKGKNTVIEYEVKDLPK